MVARKIGFEELSARRPTLAALRGAPRHPVIVILDDVRSLYNVGSIFRTCDAARVERLVLTGHTPHPPRKEIEKTALGATESVPWEHVPDGRDVLERLQGTGWKIAALEIAEPSRAPGDLGPADFPLAIIVGSEIAGVRDELLARADFALTLPMHGIKHSLNAAVACGAALYGIMGRWGG